MPQLTLKQKLFIEEYIIDFNQYKAALRAGYAESSASNAAWKLLKREDVQALIKDAIEDRKASIIIDQKWVVTKLVEVVNRCMQGEPILDKEGNQTSIWKFQPAGANKALELLGRHLGMFAQDQPRVPDDPEHLGPDDMEVLEVFINKKVEAELAARGINGGNGANGNGRGGSRKRSIH